MSSLDEMLLLHLLLGGNIESLVFPPSSRTTTSSHHHHHHHHHYENKQGVSTTIPVDILETQNEFHFFMDVPGLSKSDIQVTVEDDSILVIRSNGKNKQESDENREEKNNSINNGKRKRESSSGGEEEGCKYIRLERKASPKFLRKFRLPENSNVSAITAKCENGVLTVTVEKLPPPPKPKTVQVTIS